MTGKPDPVRALAYMIAAIMILGIAYWAATKYWNDGLRSGETLRVCPGGMAYSLNDLICVPGAEPEFVKRPVSE